MQIKYYFKDKEGNSRVIEDTESNTDSIGSNQQYIMQEYGATLVFACISNACISKLGEKDVTLQE